MTKPAECRSLRAGRRGRGEHPHVGWFGSKGLWRAPFFKGLFTLLGWLNRYSPWLRKLGSPGFGQIPKDASISPPIGPVNRSRRSLRSAGVTRPKISGPLGTCCQGTCSFHRVHVPLHGRELSVQRVLGTSACNQDMVASTAPVPATPAGRLRERINAFKASALGSTDLSVPGDYAPECHSMERHAPVSTEKPSVRAR